MKTTFDIMAVAQVAVIVAVVATLGYLMFAKPVQTVLEYRGEVCIPMPCREVWSQPWQK